MFVISLKDIIRITKKTIIIVLALVIFFNLIKKLNINFIFRNYSFLNTNILDEAILFSDYENDNEEEEKNIVKTILTSELSLFSSKSGLKTENIIKNNIEESINKENIIEEVDTQIKKISMQAGLSTIVIKENNKIDTYTDTYEGVKIKNESIYNIEDEMENINYNLTNKSNIIIYHTHTCESYTPTEENYYNQTGNYRSTDLNYSVVRVGDELTNCLKNFGFNVEHNKNYHDFPAYTGSYTRGLSTITSILDRNDSELIIDLHRDALRKLKFICSNYSNRR